MEDTNKILGKVFGSPARAKVLRFFMQNPLQPYTAGDIALRIALSPTLVARELLALRATGIVRRKSVTVRGKKGKGRRVVAWSLNDQFPYRSALEKFFADALVLDQDGILKTILRVGRIKYMVLSGIFVGLPDARIDLLVVGDLVRPQTLSKALKKIETNVCRELRLAYLTTGDFNYRRNVNDKLLRDVFDYQHSVLFDRLQSAPGSMR